MHKTMQHLNDEHMRLYEWSGAGAGTTLQDAAEKTIRVQARHASFAALTLLTSLLALNGCDSKGPVEQAGQQLNPSVGGMPSEPAHPQMNPVPASPESGTEAAEPAAPAPSQDGSPPPGASLPEQ